jgi:predicted metal-dependent HD superfamily phosphohydrolase
MLNQSHTATMNNLHNQFQHTLLMLGLEDSQATFNDLITAYTQADRYYHNLNHISECLQLLHAYQTYTKHPHEVSLAIWFHDAIYNPKRDDNEERSAHWAQTFLQSNKQSTSVTHRIYNMILATKHHQADNSSQALMMDIDLAILGSSPSRFNQYEKAIQQEYAWLSADRYYAGRSHILKSLLARETIYYTPALRRVFEQQARENLTATLQRYHKNGFHA